MGMNRNVMAKPSAISPAMAPCRRMNLTPSFMLSRTVSPVSAPIS